MAYFRENQDQNPHIDGPAYANPDYPELVRRVHEIVAPSEPPDPGPSIKDITDRFYQNHQNSQQQAENEKL